MTHSTCKGKHNKPQENTNRDNDVSTNCRKGFFFLFCGPFYGLLLPRMMSTTPTTSVFGQCGGRFQGECHVVERHVQAQVAFA